MGLAKFEKIRSKCKMQRE